MKKYLIYQSLLFLLLISCAEKKQSENDVNRFLSLFKTLSTEKLSIKPTEYLTDTTNYEFRGKIIDPTFYRFINDRYLSLGLNKNSDESYYACYKRKLNDSTYLLIIRTPYEYWESSVKLYLFNLNNSKTSDFIEVAQNWGDAGDYLEKHSILENQNFTIYKKTCWLLNEETMESECNDSIHIYKIENKFLLQNKMEIKK